MLDQYDIFEGATALPAGLEITLELRVYETTGQEVDSFVNYETGVSHSIQTFTYTVN